MRVQVAFVLLLSSSAFALSGSEKRRQRKGGILKNDRNISPRQDGLVAPGTALDCTYYDTALNGYNTCEAFQDSWGLTFDQFFDYVRCPHSSSP